ncbi:MAG: ATP-binding protein [Planctomycetota bacterium]
MTQQKPFSLRQAIFARVFPVAVALLILVSLIVIQKLNSEFRRQVQRQVNHRAEGVHLAVQTKVRHAIDACAAIANNDIVINSIVDLEHRKSNLQPFLQSLDFPGMPLNNVAMLSYNGTPIAQKLPHDSRLETLKSWMTSKSNNEAFMAFDSEAFIVGQPVRYGAAVEGALVAVYDSKQLFDDISPNGDSVAIELAFQNQPLTRWNLAALGNSSAESLIPASEPPEGWFMAQFLVQDIDGLVGRVWQSDASAERASHTVQNALVLAVISLSAVLLFAILRTTQFTNNELQHLLSAINAVRSNSSLSLRISSGKTLEFQELKNRFNEMLVEIERTTVSREKYRIPASVAKYTDNLVVVTDARGRIEWVNDSFTRVSGYSLAEVFGKTQQEMLHGPETNAAAARQMSQAIEERLGFDVQILNYSKTGNPYWASIESRPILGDDGEVVSFIAIESDVTERLRLEREKEKLTRETIDLSRQAGMAEVATGVLHNVGNVLNSVNISTNLMCDRWKQSSLPSLSRVVKVLEENQGQLEAFVASERGSQLPEVLRELSLALEDEKQLHLEELRSLCESVEHINHIVQGQQEFARAVTANEAVSAIELVEESLRYNLDGLNIEGNCRDAPIAVEKHFEESGKIFIDRPKVVQILVNLISNAKNSLLDSKVDEAKITLEIHRTKQDCLQILVRDNGVGISKENLTRIFSHGFTTRDDGHGFGLHTCALAAESLGGTLRAVSDGPGLGATFVLQLPVNQVSTQATSQEELSSTSGS